MSVQERKSMVIELTQGSIPTYPGSSKAYSGGDVSGVAVLCPEMNLESLTRDPLYLPTLLLEFLSDPFNPYDATCWLKNAEYIEKKISEGKLYARKIVPKKYYNWSSDEWFTLTKPESFDAVAELIKYVQTRVGLTFNSFFNFCIKSLLLTFCFVLLFSFQASSENFIFIFLSG